MGNLGRRQRQAGGAFGALLCDHVRRDETGQGRPQGAAREENGRVIRMTSPSGELDTDDLNEMYEFLVNAEVVEGPPGFREIVAELWPDLLHKVKPPISEMH